MPDDDVEIVVTGDLVLDEPGAGHWLAGIAPALQAADLAIGHLEVPHTNECSQLESDIPAPGAPPENLAAIAEAGISMVSLAGNHIADCGAKGIAETINGLDAVGILHAGAGEDIVSARAPAICKIKGKRIALLSYNCVGPVEAWAGEGAAGCAFLPLYTADRSPVSPRANLQGVDPEAFDILAEDIALARRDADFVVVAMHKGIVHVPALLAPYERQVTQAAIEFGADAVICHHAHIIRGIEFHRGKPIFHGLGNGCVVTRALAPDQDNPVRKEWARKRREIFGFEPDPAYSLAPFHPEAVNAFLGRITLGEDGRIETGIVPVYVEPPGRPVLPDAKKARAISAYLERITVAGGLPPISVGEGWTVKEAA